MGNVEQAEVQHMQERMDQLEKENRYLKDLLDRVRISYEKTVISNQAREDAFDPDQGARIRSVEITDELANRFFSRFWGRQDVYSKRYVKKEPEKRDIIHNAITSGQKNAPAKQERRLSAGTASAKAGSNWT